jgi:hypothetical protein
MPAKFTLRCHDRHEGEPFDLKGEFDDEAAALRAADKQFVQMELAAPGQYYVFVVRPDLSSYRYEEEGGAA